MLRNILVHVDETPASATRTDLALSLAAAHGARLTGLYVVDETASDKGAEEGGATWIAQIAAHAETLFRRRTDGATPPAQWKSAVGDRAAMVAQAARKSDLVVIGYEAAEDGNTVGTTARIALAAGRPVLVVPPSGEFPVIGHRILVAWSDTRESARAINDAMPILSSADRTVVLLVNPTDWANAADGATDITEQLSAHGIKAVILRAFANKVDTGEAILRRAQETGADMVVMGARGILTANKPILGHTTRYVLASATLPVLISS
jgi:nucleotide-binding universal stress UspA family protein